MRSFAIKEGISREDELEWFSRELWRTGDYDPAYICMYQISNDLRLPKDHQIWFYFLFAITDCSATAFFLMQYSPLFVSEKKFHDEHRELFFGKERKRQIGNFHKAVSSFYSSFGEHPSETMDQWENNYNSFWKNLENIYTLGVLTKYDFLELLGRRGLYNTIPDDIPTIPAGCRGPIKGILNFLAIEDPKYPKCKVYDYEIYPYPLVDKSRKLPEFLVEQAIILREKMGIDMALLESVLCKFQKIIDNRYYVGWEIDEELAEIMHTKISFPEWQKGYEIISNARRKVFPTALLRENETMMGDIEFLLSYKKCKRGMHMIPELIPSTPYNCLRLPYWQEKWRNRR